MNKLTLYPDQEAAVAQMVARKRTLVGSDLGTGKTVVATTAFMRVGAKVALIVGPLHVFWGWHDTYRAQGGELPFRQVGSKNKAQREAWADLEWGIPGVYFIGRELFRTKDWSNIPLDFFVYDECHALANRYSKGFKAAKVVKADYMVLQSATWFGASFEGAWAIARLLWPETIDRSYHRWLDLWAATVYDHFAPGNKKVTGEKVPGAFANSLPSYIQLKARNAHEPVFEDVYVDLHPAQRKLYDKWEKDMVAFLESGVMVADIPVVKRIRGRQLTLGVCDVTAEDKVVFTPDAPSSKFDALKEMLADMPNEQVLITSDSALFVREVARRLGEDAFAWHGGASQDDREAAKAKFVAGDLKYIVAQPASISEGTNGLQFASHVMINLSKSDNVVLHEQLIGRLNRTGQTRQVIVYNILGRGTYDDDQAVTLLTKKLKMIESMEKAA
jgi:hypothetical protein